MKTDDFFQGEDITGLFEGSAEVYVWSSTFDYLEGRMVTREVGIPCVQAASRQYPVNAKIGAVSAGQSIRIGLWESDIVVFSDDSLGDHWMLPEDFANSDTIEVNYPRHSAKWLLRCVGCSELTGAAPQRSTSSDPAYRKTTEDFLDPGSEYSGNTLLGLWNYDSATLRAANTPVHLYEITGTRSVTEVSQNGSSSRTTDISATLDIDCTNCYLGAEDGELIVDFATDFAEGWDQMSAQIDTDFKLNVELLLTLTAALSESTETNIIDNECLPLVCIGFELLGAEWKLGFLPSLDFNTQLNTQAGFTLDPGFEMLWHVGYGFAYTHDTGPTIIAADSETTFIPHYPEPTGELDVELDLAFVPKLAVGIWIDGGSFASAHGLASIKTEAYLNLRGSFSTEATTGTGLAEAPFQDFGLYLDMASIPSIHTLASRWTSCSAFSASVTTSSPTTASPITALPTTSSPATIPTTIPTLAFTFPPYPISSFTAFPTPAITSLELRLRGKIKFDLQCPRGMPVEQRAKLL
ncbi:hypothetical protein CYMTET_53667 [Cymbomonas tetramitiformis]|uniref:Uncharacterized protein n=1 Tax=Cymbomonas tetramitiformis TaxID=36881 RepID=A0AAE0BHN3_9CHLO|nr:hypothetical protein CYMTET_53667 [Cymbomonas tetramitiformis]